MSNSLVATSTETFDKSKLVSITNRAQAICLALSSDPLVCLKSQEFYKQANALLIKAMQAAY